jgi:hypothetical protein
MTIPLCLQLYEKIVNVNNEKSYFKTARLDWTQSYDRELCTTPA